MMGKIIRNLVVLLNMVFLSVSACAEAKDGLSRTVMFSQTIDSLQKGRLLEGLLWMSGDQLRMEYMRDGEMFVMIVAGKILYSYIPERKFGTETLFTDRILGDQQLNPDILQSAEKFQDYLTLMEAEKVGRDVIDGLDCDIYQFADPKTKAVNTLWVDAKALFPLKSSTHFGGDIVTVRYKNVKLGEPIDDNKFKVPADVRIEKA